jgi:hypothetical protein
MRFRIMLQAIKKPRSFSGGASVRQVRKFDYARTSPRALGGFVVFVVVFAVDIMARTYAAEFCRRQRGWWSDSNIRTQLQRAPCECWNQRTTSKILILVELWI